MMSTDEHSRLILSAWVLHKQVILRSKLHLSIQHYGKLPAADVTISYIIYMFLVVLL